MLPSKLTRVARLWFLALGMSAVPVLAGRRWPDHLPARADLAWCLVLVPPLLAALWLVANWAIPAAPPGEETHEG
jgi:hypothetical protein